MASIFSRIIAGEIPGRIVWNDDRCVVMVDIRPLRPGHCLVIPREEVDHWVDLDPDLAAHLMTVGHAVGRAQQTVVSCERIGLLVAGFEVPHTHLHVFPVSSMADFDFRNADANADPADLDRMADQLRAALRDQGHGASVAG